jgi:glycosyltransferase involved in cell wall biosynthesis
VVVVSAPVRLTAVMTHPVQYAAPWFRHIAAHCPEIDLTVLYATEPTPARQGVGFGVAFRWDTPLTEGYRCRVVRPGGAAESVDSERFWGLNVPEVKAAILDSRPDVALVPGWHSITLLRALLACRGAGIPVLYRGDTHLGSAPAGWRRPLWHLGTRLRLGQFAAYLSVGTRARLYLARFGASPCRIFDSPHAVDGDFFHRAAAPHRLPEARRRARVALGLDPDAFVVLFAGKLEPKKRPLDLVEAMARLGPGASLLGVGAGPLGEACRARAERLGVRAVWTGFLNQSELGRPYAVADCLVLPSDGRETWGLVLNEALATGLPCVVSDRVGSAPDLVTPGRTGEVFAMADVAGLAAAVGRVRARLAAGHDYGPACRERAAVHGLDRATAGLVEACWFASARRRSRGAGGARGPIPAAGAAGVDGVASGRAAPRVIACCGAMVLVSGLERTVFEILRALRERGALVHCIVNPWGSERIVPLIRELGAGCSTGRYRRRLERRPGPLAALQMAWDALVTSAGLLRDARRVRPTHVLVPDVATVLRNAPALGLLRLLGVEVIFPLANAPAPGPYYGRLWRRGVQPFVDRFVANSGFTRRELLAHGIPRTAVSTIHPCAPRRASAAPAASREAGLVVYVGQVIPGKGLDLLLEAMALLVAAGRDVHLEVVGDMDGWEPPGWRGYRARIRARAGERDLAGRVRFLGEREDVPALLARASVHCCPSAPEIREGFGLVNVEAKEAGTPSVVCPTGALPELIEHGVDGWICSEASPAAIAEGIEYLLKDPDRLERAGRAARRSARRFSPDDFAARWRTVFE